MVNSTQKQVKIYLLRNGQVPFLDWLRSLKDQNIVHRIHARIARLRLGNFGQMRSVGCGVMELKIDYGPGYRIYFGQDSGEFVILLCGGDKSTQDEDIKSAKEYWKDYKEEKACADY